MPNAAGPGVSQSSSRALNASANVNDKSMAHQSSFFSNRLFFYEAHEDNNERLSKRVISTTYLSFQPVSEVHQPCVLHDTLGSGEGQPETHTNEPKDPPRVKHSEQHPLL
jgi:hypothetical protein